MKKMLFLFIVLCAILLSACSSAVILPASSTQLTDGTGEAYLLEAPAQRIVSLGASNTEILFAIGADAQIVACDEFSDYPEAAIPLATVASGFGRLNIESILAAEPDLVLAAEIISRDQVEAMRAVGLRVFWLSNPKGIDGYYENIRIAGMLSGREEETAALLASLQERVSAIQETVAASSYRPVVYYELDATDPQKPYTAGPGTFIDLMIQLAGGKNFGESLALEWAQISSEEVLRVNPDFILLGDALYGITPESVRARPGWSALDAVKNGNVVPFDDNLASRPGPRFIDGVEILAQLLHPQLFGQ